MKGEYVLIDANDSRIDWDTICRKIPGWKISVGTLHPEDTDMVGGMEITAEDVSFLAERARGLVSDTKRYMDLALRFVLITREDEISKVLERINE